jgi:hypothetical protein
MTLPASDSFTTTTNQTLTAYSSNWTSNINNFSVYEAGDDILSNAGYGECGAHWNADTFNADQYSRVRISKDNYTDETSPVSLGPAVRCHASAATYYGFYAMGQGRNSDENYLFVMEAGVWTQIGSMGTLTVTVNDIMRLEASGTTLTPTINGSTTGTPGAQTNEALAGGYAGVTGYHNTDYLRMDDWEGGNLNAATGQPMQIRGVQVPGLRQWQPGRGSEF